MRRSLIFGNNDTQKSQFLAVMHYCAFENTMFDVVLQEEN